MGKKRIKNYRDSLEIPPKATQDLTGQEGVMIETGGKPTKLPKDKRKGAKESYRPFSGYKGHR